MRRRDVLKAAAGTTLLSGIRNLGISRAMADAAAPPFRSRVRPGDPQWPDSASWSKLRDQVGGTLIEVHPLFESCVSPGGACDDALNNIKNPFWVGDQPAGTEVSGWLDAWTPAPSVYAIKVRNASDIAAGVTFARKNNLRLVVKGGRHSYLGTSNAPDSLLICTRAMNKVTLHDAFVAKGCEGRVEPVPAVSAEAGAVWMDLYNAVTMEGGRYVQGVAVPQWALRALFKAVGLDHFRRASAPWHQD